MAQLDVHEVAETNIVDIEARGGTRRERGATIAAYVRMHPGMERVHIHYSETYGFQSATYARYRKVKVHVVSAAAIRRAGDPSKMDHLAMCGENLGDYYAASEIHPVGNFMAMGSPSWDRVTCEGCRKRVLESRAR